MKMLQIWLVMFLISFLQARWTSNSHSNLNITDHVEAVFGQKTAVIIPADFLDMNFSTRKDLIEQLASNMSSYFKEVSYDKMFLEVDIANKTYKLPHNMSFYANMPEELARNCISRADPDIDYNFYDYVLAVHAGPSRRPNKPEWIQTCVCLRKFPTDDGKILDSCAILSEYDPLFSFCHETAHLFGLPDLYPESSHTQGNVGCWDLMGRPTISQRYDSPSQLSAWSRLRLGWMNSTLVKTVNMSVTRDITMLHNLETAPWWLQTKAIKVPVANDIYYLVELRNQILSDRDLPSSGILVYRCDESSSDGKSHSIMVMDTSLDDFRISEDGKTYSDAAFNDDRPLFCDPVNGIAIEVWGFSSEVSFVTVYRQKKLHTLKLALPQSGIGVTIDGRPCVSDENGWVFAIVLSGNHTVRIDLPVSPFYTVTSFRWSDGDTANPREIQLLSDETFVCFYNLETEAECLTWTITALIIITGLLTLTVLLVRRRYVGHKQL